jgi:hypothetical protein
MDAHPKGEELAKYIYEKLEQKGLKIFNFDNYDDFAWSVSVGSDKVKPWLLTGYVGDGDYEWLIQINSGVGFFGKLMGKNDFLERDNIATKLDEILKAEAIFSIIRWHEGDFAKGDYSNAP